MTQPPARPEDRSRSGIDSRHAQPWADTHAACFRSEGFAEDLGDESSPGGGQMGSARAALHPAAARPPRSIWSATWRLRGSNGALPILGLALAGVLGALAR